MQSVFRVVLSLFVSIICSGSIYGTSPTDIRLYEDSPALDHEEMEEEPKDYPGKERRSYGYAGFSIGVGQLGFSLHTVNDFESMGFSKIRAVSDLGFNIGIVFNFFLFENLDLRLIPSFTFGKRFVEYYEDDLSNFPYLQELDPYTLELPLLFKYNFYNVSNSSIYAVGGVKYSYDFNSAEGYVAGDDFLYFRTLREDFHIEAGLGFQIKLKYIKLSTEIKGSFGIKNLVLPGDEDHPLIEQRHWEAIDRLHSRNFMISLIIE